MINKVYVICKKIARNNNGNKTIINTLASIKCG